MNEITVIRKPLVTEKNTFASGEFNRYAFEVDCSASKPQIKRAVESLYDVRVLDVAVQNRRGRTKRNKFGIFRVGKHKRAIVKIHPDDRIELF